jgi:hypothetical protein
VFDADLQGLRFIRSGGILQFDTYTVTLASGPAGFHDSFGALDGNNDGTTGDDAVLGFDFRSTGAGVLSLPDFMRGPGQAVDVPATGQYLPVSFTSAGGLRTMVFTVGFDPSLLDITGARAGAGLPAGTELRFVREAAANGGQQARITLILPGDVALAAGTQRLVDLVATVPATAVYGRKEVVDLSVTQINGNAPVGGVADDDALHVVGYFGDTSGSADYSTLDVQLIQRYVVKLDAGFAAWRNVDPVLVADVAGGGSLNSLDASRLLQEVNFLTGVSTVDRLEIPPIPAGIPPIVFAGPDPLVDLPRDRSGRPGQLVSVPVRLDTALGLDSVQLRVAYDSSVFELVAVRPGTLTADFGWFVAGLAPGQVTVDMARLSALPDGSGSLLVLDLRVRANAPAGDAVIDLAYARLNDSRLTLGVLPQPGADPTDGLVHILAPAAASAAGHPLAAGLPATPFAAWAAGSAQADGDSLPLIRLDRPASAKAAASVNVDGNGKAWLRDYLTGAGQPAKASPNVALKVVLPRVSGVLAPLSNG